jgi:release factor glutamine methyltransferase
VIDLGTGSGAIALSVALERPGTEVWAVDVSAEAIAVARANLAGLGMAGSHVRVVEGSWFGAVPDDVAGRVHVVVTNPPYVATTDVLPASVIEWEPAGALLAGEDGLDAYREILADSPRWLVPGGALVAEIGATQGPALLGMARAVGLVDARIVDDHAGHPRTLVAHAPR